MKPILLITIVVLIISQGLLACSSQGPSVIAINGQTMGTTYSVKYVNNNDTPQVLKPAQMKIEVDNLLLDINQLMSTYIPNSELSRLNSAPANKPFPISSETEYVIGEALKLHELSNGMLDITVGPLVNQWGFGPEARPTTIPSTEQLANTVVYVGVDNFELSSNAVTKFHQNVYIDLSTIAKGYAVDEIAQLLELRGIRNYLVEIGGEMRLAGTKPHHDKWTIAIEKPISGARLTQQIISIGDNAIATSGDYRNYFEEDGIRYSHLIDPLTGYPIQHNLVSVTVVAPMSIHADGLATALMVMGLDEGRALAEKEGIAAFFITKENGEFREYESDEFTRQVEVLERKSKR